MKEYYQLYKQIPERWERLKAQVREGEKRRKEKLEADPVLKQRFLARKRAYYHQKKQAA